MASLTGKFIKDTYQSLLKLIDNGNVTSTAKEITDGEGNGTGVSLSNDGSLDATGTVSFGSLKDSGENITVTKFVDEADGIGNNNNDTTIPTSAAVKNYVDTNVTAQDLDFQGDSGTGAIDLDSELLDIAGGTGIDTSASNQTLTVSIDSTVATLTGTQTLTNKTVDADNNTVSNLEVDNLKSGVLDTDLTTVSASDDTIASAKAIKTYVDSNITAQDLDITDGTTTSAVDLDSQTLTIEGTANEVEVSLTDQTFTIGLPTSITTNVTGDVTGNADTASALETARTISLSGDVAGSVSFDGSANADITATIQANSVALGTDTTGDYVENLGTGTGVTIGSNTGEGSSPTIIVDYGSTANTAVQGNTSLTIQGTANEIEVSGGGVTLGSGGTVTVGLPDDVSLGGSLTIAQNLTVNGTTTTVNTDTLSVEDPLIELARDNSENSVDVGLYGKYSLDSGVTTKYSGLFKDASDSDKFKLFKGLEVEPTSTVNTSGTGYTKGDLVINDLDAVTISGTISTAAQTNITSVGTLSSLTVGGDLTVDTNTLYVDSSNNRVGIGTLSPSYPLSIRSTGDGIKFEVSDNVDANCLIEVDGTDIKFGSSTSSDLVLMTSFSERMRIDSSGNVGIGESNPSNTLTIKDEGYQIAIIDESSGNISEILSSNDSMGFFADRGNAVANSKMLFSVDGSERMRIDSSGNVGIGVSPSTGYKLHIRRDTNAAIGFGLQSSEPSIEAVNDAVSANVPLRIYGSELKYYTSATERMRITSGGEVQIGTAGTTLGAPTYKGKIRMAKASEFESNIEFITTDFSSGYGWSIGSHDQSGGVIDLNFYSRANSATFTKRFLIEANGNVKSSTGSYGTISSDERLKENILNASPKLEDILSLNVKNYNYIGEDSKQIGFIAQEFEQVFPSLVTERDTREYDEEGNVISGYEDTKGLKVGMEFAILVKAMQEQQAIIQELKAEIETLKAQINN